jgi:hypothetical protein
LRFLPESRRSRRLGRLSGGERGDLRVFQPQVDNVRRENARPAIGDETLNMRLLLMALKSRAVAVNLIDDPLHWRLGHHVDDINQRLRLGSANSLGRAFRQPVEFRRLIVKQRENG